MTSHQQELAILQALELRGPNGCIRDEFPELAHVSLQTVCWRVRDLLRRRSIIETNKKAANLQADAWWKRFHHAKPAKIDGALAATSEGQKLYDASLQVLALVHGIKDAEGFRRYLTFRRGGAFE